MNNEVFFQQEADVLVDKNSQDVSNNFSYEPLDLSVKKK